MGNPPDLARDEDHGFRELFDLLPFPAVITDLADSSVLAVNHRTLELFQVTADEALTAHLRQDDHLVGVLCLEHVMPTSRASYRRGRSSGTTSTPAFARSGSIPLFLQDLDEIGESEHDLLAGDRLVFFSDGIIESENATREMYGVDRLARAVAVPAGSSPRELVEQVVADLDGFVAGGEPEDDQTLVVAAVERVRRSPGTHAR